MGVKYKGHELIGADTFKLGKMMVKLDELEIFKGDDFVLVVKDDKVVDRRYGVNLYQFYKDYYDEKVRT